MLGEVLEVLMKHIVVWNRNGPIDMARIVRIGNKMAITIVGFETSYPVFLNIFVGSLGYALLASRLHLRSVPTSGYKSSILLPRTSIFPALDLKALLVL